MNAPIPKPAATFPDGRASLLKVQELSVRFETALGQVMAASRVSFELYEKETLALVGETGCGKSVIASAIMQLLARNARVDGRIIYAGRDLLHLSEREMSCIRGSEIAIVFQNPSLSLNPILQAGKQIAEPLQIHRRLSWRLSSGIVNDMLRRLGLKDAFIPAMYPFQFSGGMNQRIMIATSMILSPRIIIADEPSKGLDCALASDVMAHLANIRDRVGSSLLLITHDLTLARSISDRIAVMYCGEIVEIGSCQEIFDRPLHPYTKALINCLPENGFVPIPGGSPSMIDPPLGCKFCPRCQKQMNKCRWPPKMVMPEIADSNAALRDRGEDRGFKASKREVRCWLY